MKKTQIIIVGITAMALLALPPSDNAPISQLCAAAEPATSILAEFEFELGEPQLTLPFELEMNRYRFIMATRDTTSFAKPFANTLPRLPPEVDSPDHSIVAFRRAPQVSLGALMLRFPLPSVQCVLSPLGNQCLSQCDGVFGLDILVQHIVQIDFDCCKIRFLRTMPDDPGDRFEISSLQRTPRLCAVTVKAQCCSEPAQDFSVELESPDSIYLRSSVCGNLVEKGEFRCPHIESTFDTTSAPVCCVGTASSFTLGRFRTKDIRAVVHRDNVIGLGYLSRYVVTFDFPSGAMYLRPGKQFDRADGYDVSGLIARMRDDSLEVIDCEFKSPAYNAGLREQDAIIDVDGQPVNRKNQSSFRKQMRQQGSTMHVHFKRRGVDRTVEIKLPVNAQEAIDQTDPIPGDQFRDSVPNFTPRSAPSELLEIEESDEPQNAGHGGTRKEWGGVT